MTNSSLRHPRRRQAVAALSVAASMVLLSAAPAYAVGNTGTGSDGDGQEDSITYGQDYGTSTMPFCMEVTASSYTMTFDGPFDNYNADNGTTDATYTGPATLTFSTTETYFIGPDGTYTDADMVNGCDTTTLGDPIDATVSVTGGNTTAGISCGPDPASYSRLTMAISVDWEGDCTVYDSGNADVATTPSTTDHEVDATLTPCFNPPNPCTESTISEGTWAYLG